MYLLVKFGGHRSYGNGDTNDYIHSYMNTSEKAELITLIHNPGHNILELYKVLVQIRLTTSKTKRDV